MSSSASNPHTRQNELSTAGLTGWFTRFLVALLLCLSIALACGAPLYFGLVAGMISGVVIGLLSGSEMSVSELAVIAADAMAKISPYGVFLVAVVLAGLMLLILGLIKAGRFSSFFPDSFIK